MVVDRVRVAITQPYIANYRVPMFEQLLEQLDKVGIEGRVFFGPHKLPEARQRGEVATPPWGRQVNARAFQARWGSAVLRQIPREWSRPGDLLLTELEAGNANAWAAMARRRPYLLLGHGKGYTSDESSISVALETRLARSAAHVLTYMESGRLEVLRRTGLTPSQVTSFNNTTDTTALVAAVDAITEGDIAEFRSRHGIHPMARCGLYVGALEAYKRLDLLCAAARIALAADPDLWLIVAGDGSQAPRLHGLAAETGRVTLLGHVPPTGLAILARVANLLLNPGRVGLLAVDAMAMRLPVLTTSSARHAPEIEYLTEGRNLITTAGEADAFARAWLTALSSAVCITEQTELPTIAYSVGCIVDAVLAVVGSATDAHLPPRRSAG